MCNWDKSWDRRTTSLVHLGPMSSSSCARLQRVARVEHRVILALSERYTRRGHCRALDWGFSWDVNSARSFLGAVTASFGGGGGVGGSIAIARDCVCSTLDGVLDGGCHLSFLGDERITPTITPQVVAGKQAGCSVRSRTESEPHLDVHTLTCFHRSAPCCRQFVRGWSPVNRPEIGDCTSRDALPAFLDHPQKRGWTAPFVKTRMWRPTSELAGLADWLNTRRVTYTSWNFPRVWIS